MARQKPAIVVEPRPDGRWARQKNGTQRAASLHNTQAQAERATAGSSSARADRARRQGRERADSRRDSFGNDAYPAEGLAVSARLALEGEVDHDNAEDVLAMLLAECQHLEGRVSA